jgi:hypothetical protein
VAERKLNKKLKRAIDQGYDLFWEFGLYNTYYHGLVLRARTKVFENGRVLTQLVFAATSIDLAKEIHEIIRSKKSNVVTGWKEALRDYENNRSSYYMGYQRNRSYG